MKFRMVKRVVVSVWLALTVSVMVFVSTFASAASYKDWRQGDSEWGSMMVGSSGYTMRAIGCAVTSTAILMVRSGAVTDPGFDPGKFLTYLNQAGAFGPEGDLDWTYVERYGADFAFTGRGDLKGLTEKQMIARIRSWLEDGYYVMVNVKGGAHFVAVDEVVGNTVRMMDPASSSNDLFGYYEASGVAGARLFKRSGQASAGTADLVEPAMPELPAPPFSVLLTEPPVPEMTPPPFSVLFGVDPTHPPMPEQADSSVPDPVTPPMPEQTEAQVTDPTHPPMPAQFDTLMLALKEAPKPELAEAPMAEPAQAPTEPSYEAEKELVTPPQTDNDVPKVGTGDMQYMVINMNACTEEAVTGYLMPDCDAEVLLEIPAGAELKLMLVTEDYAWGMTEYDGQACWIMLENVTY